MPKAVFEILPIGISKYQHHPQVDQVETDLEVVVERLSEIGGRVRPFPDADRSKNAITEYLADWSADPTPRNSLIIWMGHGHSEPTQSWLAASGSRSPMNDGTGISAQDIATSLRAEWKHRIAGDRNWTVVVVESCGAADFARHLVLALPANVDIQRIAVIGAGSSGLTFAGNARAAIEATIDRYRINDDIIHIPDLVADISRELGPDRLWTHGIEEAMPIVRTRSIPGMRASLDSYRRIETRYREVEDEIAKLPDDERRHFIEKARSGEVSELAWMFAGRKKEMKELATWLRTAESGMFTVTGPPGSGKSALLGQIYAASLPKIWTALTATRQVDTIPAAERPPDGVFDAVVHLSGRTAGDLVRRLATAAGRMVPADDRQLSGLIPAQRRASARTTHVFAWSTGHGDGGVGDPGGDTRDLITALRRRASRFTVLVDALDESLEPVAIAESVLRPISELPNCRVVVGTRPGIADLDGDEQHDDLVAALGAVGTMNKIPMRRDTKALRSYITKRLTEGGVSGTWVEAVAPAIVSGSGTFLFTRLAVNEVMARRLFLDKDGKQRSVPDKAGHVELTKLLAGDHRALFRRAVRRLADEHAAARPLLEALAVARGRGMPRAGGVWRTAAEALSGVPIADDDIDWLIQHAEAYLMLDAESRQSVYRLAHATFASTLVAELTPGDEEVPARAQQAAIAERLIALANEDGPMNPYLERHLAGHVAEGRVWEKLAAAPMVLDRLDPTSVASNVLRTSFGRLDVPPPIAAVAGASHLLSDQQADARAATRAVAAARYTPVAPTAGDRLGANWAWKWAHLRKDPLHLVIAAGLPRVSCLSPVVLDRERTEVTGRTVLAGGSGTTVRFWDPMTGRPTGRTIALAAEVRAICAIPLPDWRTALAVSTIDGSVSFFNPVTGDRVAQDELTFNGPVWSMTRVVDIEGAAQLAIGTDDGQIVLWRPDEPGRRVVADLGSAVLALTTFEHDGAPVLVAGTRSGNVVCLDPITGATVGHQWRRTASVLAIAAPISADDTPTLVVGLIDGRVRLWNPFAGRAAGGPAEGHLGSVDAAAWLPIPGEIDLAATAGGDGAVRIWDVDAPRQLAVLSGHERQVTAITSVIMPDNRCLLATASVDGTVRLWDPAPALAGWPSESRAPADEIAPRSVIDVAAVMPDGSSAKVVTSFGNSIALRDAETGADLTRYDEGWPRPLHEQGVPVTAVTVVNRPFQHPILVSARANRTIELWDLRRASPIGLAIPTPMRIRSLTSVTDDDGTLLVAVGIDGSVMFWDLDRRTVVGDVIPPRGGHLRVASASELDGRLVVLCESPDGRLILRSARTHRRFGRTMAGHEGAVTAAAWIESGDRRLLATAGEDRTIRLWDPRTGSGAVPAALPTPVVSDDTDGGSDAAESDTDVDPSVLGTHDDVVTALASITAPDGRHLLVSASKDGTVRTWDPSEGMVSTIFVAIQTTSLVVIDQDVVLGTEFGPLTLTVIGPNTDDA